MSDGPLTKYRKTHAKHRKTNQRAGPDLLSCGIAFLLSILKVELGNVPPIVFSSGISDSRCTALKRENISLKHNLIYPAGRAETLKLSVEICRSDTTTVLRRTNSDHDESSHAYSTSADNTVSTLAACWCEKIDEAPPCGC